MKVVVIGAGSFIGGELTRLCEARGIQVVGIDVVASGLPGFHQVDIRDRNIADLIPMGADAVVHLAALSRDPDCRDRAYECFDVNVLGTLNVMEAAKARQAKQFVFASSEWVYDSFQPGREKDEDTPIDATRLTSEYALSKYVSEVNLRQKAAHGFCPATIVRLGIVYGPRAKNWSAVETLLNAVATQDEIKVGALATARRFIHVTDVAEGIMATFGRSEAFDLFNIQGPALTTLEDVIESASALLCRRPRIVETAPVSPSVRPVSSRKAASILGWSARIGIRAGLADVAEKLQLAPAAH